MKHFDSADQIKVGVIGYGGAFNMGKAHLDQMQLAGMTPVAVAEIDESRLEIAKTDFPGIDTYTSIDEMLSRNDVNLITIITPHNSHHELGMKCLEAGRHVVCEKPLAITTDEVDAMMEAAARNQVVLSTYHNRHWDGCILEAVDQIRKNRIIGDIVRIDAHMTGYGQPGDWWRSSKTISGGILFDWGVHLIEYSLQLLDPKARLTEVSGFAHHGYWAPKTKWKDDTNEDEAYAVARFDTGQWLTVHFSHLDSKGKDGQVEIMGTEGTYVMDQTHYHIYKKRGESAITEERPNRPGEQEKYYLNVADHLTGKDDLVITAEWSRRPIEVLDLAVKSAEQGKALAV